MDEKLKELVAEGPIVFYDGDCGLCDWFVKKLVRVDKRHVLRYSTLQGDTARELLGAPVGDPENWSVKVVDSNGIHLRSTAALIAIASVGGGWKAAKVLLLVPKFLRDGIYRLVAKNRKKMFGTANSCALPTPALRERFLP